MLVVVKGGFWDIFDHTAKKSRSLLGVVKNVLEFPFYNYCNRFGDTFWPNHTRIFSKAVPRPRNFLSTLWTEKKSPNLGYGLARPRIFRDLSKEISAHPPSEFFPIHVSGLEKLYVKSVSHTLELFVHDVELSIQRDENMALNIS